MIARLHDTWEDAPLRSKGLVVVTLPLVALVVAAVSFVIVTWQGEEAQRLVAHTLAVDVEIQQALTLMVDAETGVRGYYISGRSAYLEPFTRAEAALPVSLDRLAALVGDNPAQAARLERVTDLVARRLAALRVLRQAAPAADAPLARPPDAALDAGKALMDLLRAELDAMRQEEARLLAEREALADAVRQQGIIAVALSLPVGILGGLMATLLFTAGIARRVEALAENAGRLAARRPPLPPPAGGDEIGRLGRGLAAADDLLTTWGRELRAARAFLEHLIAASPGLICRIGLPEPRVTYVSPNLTHLLGYAPEEALGEPTFWRDLIHPDDLAGVRGAFGRLMAAVTARDAFEVRYRHQDGSYRWFYVMVRLEEDAAGAPASVLAYGVDITALKEAEAALRQANEELERRVSARTADLLAANEHLARRQRDLEGLTIALRRQARNLERQSADLAAANRALEQKNDENEMFVYSVSHDLRSPLVNLQGFSQEVALVADDLRALLLADEVPEALRQRARALLDEEMATSLGFIQAAVMRLSGIIDALLRLSRAGRVEYARRVVDMEAMIARIVTSLHGTITADGATVEVGTLPPAWGDATALEQVFANLITNAVTYRDPRRPARIVVGGRAEVESSEGVRTHVYHVADNGLGIPDHARARLFQPFQRFHPDAAAGEGLGLAMVRRIVERHGGTIWVESTVGVGTTFFVRLPAPPAGRAGEGVAVGGSWSREEGGPRA